VKEVFNPTSVLGYFQKTDFRPADGKLAPMPLARLSVAKVANNVSRFVVSIFSFNTYKLVLVNKTCSFSQTVFLKSIRLNERTDY